MWNLCQPDSPGQIQTENLDKMEEAGLIEEPFVETEFRFKFADAGELSPPLISFSEVAFSYSGKKSDYLFSDISFGIHPKSRIVLVGPNGAGKSTLLKGICGENSSSEGTINPIRNVHRSVSSAFYRGTGL